METHLRSWSIFAIWKISIDADTRSNTLSQLKYDLDGTPRKTRNGWTAKERDIDTYRSKYLAHNDIQKPPIPLTRKDLEILLDAIRGACNSLCRPEVDERVQKIEDVNLYNLAIKVKWSFGVILQCTQNFYKEEINGQY